MIRLWDWHDIDFEYNPISEEYVYYYKIPQDLYEKLEKEKKGNSFLLETTPKEILEEIFSESDISFKKKSKKIKFKNEKIKHIKRPSTISSIMEGWGEPITMGVLQESFFMLLLRQAQAVLLADYIIPIRIVSPDAKALELMEISQFAMHFDAIYDSFQKDPFQIMKFPFPIMYQTLSGEAKQIFLSNEIEYVRNTIRRGIGLPAELLDGSLQYYSAGSVFARMFENFAYNFIKSVIYDLTNNFILPQICDILELNDMFRIDMARLKTIDDINQKRAILELFDRNLVPDTYIYDNYNIPRPVESELMDSINRRIKRESVYKEKMTETDIKLNSSISERGFYDKLKQEDLMLEKEKERRERELENENMQTPQGFPPPRDLAFEIISKVKNRNEINKILKELSEKINNQEYVQSVINYINSYLSENQNGLNINNNTTNVNNNKSLKFKDLPEQKPQRSNTPI